MKTGKCIDCSFFDDYEEAGDGQEAWGTCNRYPPVLFSQTAKDAHGIDDEINMMWKQPGVIGSDWCGEFNPCAYDAPTDAPIATNTVAN